MPGGNKVKQFRLNMSDAEVSELADDMDLKSIAS